MNPAPETARKGKLFDYLYRLSKRERRAFLDFFPSGKEKLKSFLEELLDALEGPEAEIPEEELWSVATGEPIEQGKNLDPQKSKILSHLQDYFAWLALKEDSKAKGLFFLREINRRDLDREVEVNYKKMKRQSNQSDAVTSERYHYHFELDMEYNLHYNRLPRSYNPPHLETLYQNLDAYYLIQKLRFSCVALTRNKVFNEVHHVGVLEPLLRNVEAHPDQHPPLVHIYYHIYMMLAEPENIRHYLRLINLLEENHPSLSREELPDLYQHAANYCIRKINQGNLDFQKRLVELYEFQLEEGIIQDQHGRLAPRQMKNITLIMCRMGELDWVERFLDDYRKGKRQLSDEFNGFALQYNQGVLHFFREEFERALEKFSDIWWQYKFRNVFYDLDLRTYLIKTLCELRAWEDELLISLKDSFRKFVSEKSGNTALSEQHKGNYRTFANRTNSFVNTMISPISTAKKVRKLKRLAEQLEQQRSALNIPWLLNKVKLEIERLQEA